MLNALKSWVKRILKLFHQRQRVKELAKTRPAVTRAELVHDLRKMGVNPGDLLFVHSSLKSLGFVEGGPETVISALLEAVGEDGTVMLPTYYMPGGGILSTCQIPGYEFDPRVHGTNMGALPEAFLKFPNVHRSIHPTHSCAAIGKHASYLTDSHHLAPSVFGEGSPWERCWKLNGKIFGLGINMGPVTFYHLLEDRTGDAFPLPVRMTDEFKMPCRDWDGNQVIVPVRALDPKFQAQRIDNKSRQDLREYFFQEFQAAGIIKTGLVCQASAWYITSHQFLQHLKILMNEGITIYSTAEELSFRPVIQKQKN